MATYTNYKCPNCGFSFSGGYRNFGIGTNLGPEEMECPSCHLVVKTGKKPYSKMSSTERSNYWFLVIVQALINGIVVSLFATLLVGENLILGFLIGYLITIPLMIVFSKNQINKLENALKNKDRELFIPDNEEKSVKRVLTKEQAKQKDELMRKLVKDKDYINESLEIFKKYNGEEQEKKLGELTDKFMKKHLDK